MMSLKRVHLDHYVGLEALHCCNRRFVGVFFFFKQKTAYEIVSRDWSSDVCSSDLILRIQLDDHQRPYQLDSEDVH